MGSRAATIEPQVGTPFGIWRVIAAAAAGTMIEWYDFYVFGSLAAVLSLKFYPPGNDTFAYIAYLATFAVGFVVRPFGALFFGRIGDLVGRKYAFLATLFIMGGATTLIGLLPTFATAGWFAPVTLIVIRTLQGLAVGGEYGGAAVYVAEHVADHKRGFYTSFIQITAMLGLLVSLIVILLVEQLMSREAFGTWGWRIPFLLSFLLVFVSLYVRLKMKESPIFAKIKSAGQTSTQPLKDSFASWDKLRRVLIILFGVTAGQGVVAYTGQFYSLFFLQTILRVNMKTANIVVALALLIGMPFVTLCGSLSDKIGRKWLMMVACLLAVCTYIPVYKAMERAAGNNVVTVKSTRNTATGAIGLTAIALDPSTRILVPAKEAPNPNVPMLVFLVGVQVLYISMIYGPIAAYLVETFPARIRYTSLSLPYHVGNGVMGGLLPVIGLSVCAATGNIYAGLYYPIIVAGLTLVVGTLMLKETHGTRIWDEVGGHDA
jgi:MFS family permease